jgi:hypothetical protein
MDSCLIKDLIMEHIEKRNGYVYLVSGRKGFETYFNVGKDPDELNKPKKDKKTKKETND